ncbi:hypothetical protein [Acinetobacter lwoffii]|uniref:hypothetical protein n=1 Tax=Acinetobacter lwoffii TaxID=28090 RepID=UPI0030089432
MQEFIVSKEVILELNRGLFFVGGMGFIVGLFFGILIGWILYSCLEQYYKEN